MSTIISILSVAFTVAIALIVLLSIPAVREWVGLGDIQPSGIPGAIAEKVGG